MRTLTLLAFVFAPFLAHADEPDYINEIAAPAVHFVSMTQGDRFVPSRLTIRVGDSVLWTNRDDEAHTVTADPRKATNPSHWRLPQGVSTFDSGDIASGKTFTKSFTTPGTYIYFCTPHQDHGMIGTIEVVR